MDRYAVFSDRCNSTMRHTEDLTEEQAQAEAHRLTLVTKWYHYAAPTDFNPHGDYPDMSDIPEEEWNNG